MPISCNEGLPAARGEALTVAPWRRGLRHKGPKRQKPKPGLLTADAAPFCRDQSPDPDAEKGGFPLSSPMSLSSQRKKRLARERQRRHRERVKTGKRLVTVEIDDVDAAVALAAEGVLDPQRDDDADAMREAIERTIARLCSRHA